MNENENLNLIEKLIFINKIYNFKFFNLFIEIIKKDINKYEYLEMYFLNRNEFKKLIENFNKYVNENEYFNYINFYNVYFLIDNKNLLENEIIKIINNDYDKI